MPPKKKLPVFFRHQKRVCFQTVPNGWTKVLPAPEQQLVKEDLSRHAQVMEGTGDSDLSIRYSESGVWMVGKLDDDSRF